jgi:FtsP/CotA-like multicopper oxidase with cupredoxin domain
MRSTRTRRLRRGLALLLAAAVPLTVTGMASSAPGESASRANALGRPMGLNATSGATLHSQGKVSGKPRAPAAAVTINLCAKKGSLILPKSIVVSVWGFALKPSGVPCGDPSVQAQVPGPVIDLVAGDEVTVNVTNTLNQNVSVIFPGQGVPPDFDGVPRTDRASYTFTPSAPGTFLYEAGANAQVQIPMGMFGALIVRPSVCLVTCVPIPNQAYDDLSTAYDVEAIMVLSEIDPAFNAHPMTFDFTNWAPKYWLINGKTYPRIRPPISATAGQKVLLRYLNAGVDHHTMTLLGAYQREIAADAFPLPFPFDAVSETIPAGQTKDMIVTVPSAGSFPLYSANLNVTNVDSYPGGMMTFIKAT